jgi:hypothetical protein
MLQILMVVLAIALLAVVVGAGVSYVSLDAGQRYASSQMLSSGFQAWERAYTAYRIANRASPATAEDLAAFLPSGGLKAPSGMVWGFGRDASGAFACLYGETRSENDMAAMIRLSDSSSKVTSVPAAAISYGPSCGAVGPLALGEPLAVTYRLAQ